MPRQILGFISHLKRKRKAHPVAAGITHSPLAQAMDKGVYAIGVMAQVMTLPQIFKIFVEKDASGVSVATWISFVLVCLFWVVYGLAHRERSIVFSYSILTILDAAVVVGALMYS